MRAPRRAPNGWRSPRRLLLAAGVVAASVAVAGSALAAPTVVQAGGIQRVQVAHDTVPTVAPAVGTVNLLPVPLAVTVPAGGMALLVARFSGESRCFAGFARCVLGILVDGVPMDPVSPAGFNFDSTDNNTKTFAAREARSVERSKVVGPGPHVVQVRIGVVGGAASFTVDDWHLSVEQAPM